MVDGFGVMCLVDGNSRVNNLGSNNLLLDYGLDVLVNVMMGVFPTDHGGRGSSVSSIMGNAVILVLGGITLQMGTDIFLVAVMELLVLDSGGIVDMLLRPGKVWSAIDPCQETWLRVEVSYKTSLALIG